MIRGVLLVLAASLPQEPGRPAAPPKAVIVISVDQMRADYLTRFAEQYTGGLARLTGQGAVFTNAHQEHAITHTAPGHATISTGVFPARSGIVSNDWWDRVGRQRVYAVEDRDAPILGDATAPGRSPANLIRNGIGDWLKQASPASKVFAVAIKDRSAILMAGKRPDAAYWYDYETGRFVTSSYYGATYAPWVQAFNESGPARSYFDAGWTKLLPDPAYYLSREDSFPSEGSVFGSVFPHRFDGTSADTSYYRRLPYTPFADQLVFEFARTLVVSEAVGADDAPDVLFIGASAADYIGHVFGPYSQEVQDYYLRLDRMLAEFFSFLDGQIGAGSYTTVLTADHGVVPMPEELARRGRPGHRVSGRDLQEVIVPALTDAMKELRIKGQPSIQLVTGLVVTVPDSGVSVETIGALRSRIAKALTASSLLADAFTYDELQAGTDTRPFFELYHRSFHPDRAPDIFLHHKEGHLISSSSRGTGHGSPYRYDTRVPLIFAGSAIPPGRHGARVRTVDIAPTLARLLEVTPPDDLDGRTLEWVLTSAHH